MRLPVVMLLALTHLGCSGGLPECVPAISADCAPLYPPTYDNVYDRTLLPSCGRSGAACHATEGAQGDLVFADRDDAYATLLEASRGLVKAGDDACSLLTVRIDAPEDADTMPPGRRLSTAERCAIRRWIAEGAAR